MKDKKVLFMGTPLFATVVLDALIRNTNVVGVVCQNDKIVGRKKVFTKCFSQTLIQNFIQIC